MPAARHPSTAAVEARRPRQRASNRRDTRKGPGRPTREQVEERNAELLDHVMDLLLAKGFDGVTIREVTKSLGMAKRTVVGRYGNKVSLCKAALERAIDAWAIPIDDLRTAETEDFETTLHKIATLLVANYISPEGLRIARVTNAEAYRMPEISIYAYRRVTEPLISYLSKLFRRFHRGSDGFPHAEEYALSFLSLLGTPSRTIAWGIGLDDTAIARRIAHTVRLFLEGLPR